MKKITIATALAALISMPIINAQAAITTNAPGTVTAIYGGGNPNTWDQVVTYTGTDGNFQLALNTHINPNNGNLNLDFSINVDPSGTPGVTLATVGDSYKLLANNSAIQGDLTGILDNQYGTSATLNGQGTKTTFLLGSVGNTIFQNSEPEIGLSAFFGVPSSTSYTLEVVSAGGAILASDTIPAALAVPEPTTFIAAALLLLPFGIGALRRSLGKQRTT